MSRPTDDPERVRLVAGESGRRMRDSLNDRFDGMGYGMFLFVIFGITAIIVASDGLSVGIFACLLMLAGLESIYHWYKRH